jgi:hypothetical protein
VVTTYEQNSEPALLRSYGNARQTVVLFNECKIWQACRATSAAPTFFDPIEIGRYKQRFIDGGMLYNNPVKLVHREAKFMWPDRKPLLISIGTGSAPGKEFTGGVHKIVKAMQEILTQTEREASDFYQSNDDLVKDNLLFRFNVTQGLADVGLQEFNEVKKIATATATYLDDGEVNGKLMACIKRIFGTLSEGMGTPLMSSRAN